MVRAMRTLLIALILVFLGSSGARAQDSTRLQRYEYVVGASLAFSLLDYVGFNLDINIHNNSTVVYRTLQVLTQAAITYILYKTCGLNSAIAFNLIWWTWGDDLGFYGYQLAFNNPAPWPNRTYRNDLRDNHITWAGWTPIGLLRPQGSAIARDALYGQAAIGFSIAMSLLW